MSFRISVLILIIGGFWFKSYSQESDKKNAQVACIAFYNVENLFDTINDPAVNDEDFLPTGSYKWTSDRYKEKINHLGKVIDELCKEFTNDGPAIMGFCEVENR
ncbi:MAG: endonuclease/exonuclease/phosphatase family protein, partial [Bacteroidia bacterium]|nr:endonuclease/exonuclease/phosphatase family protein [Bacteroidia bacterium]